MHDTEMFKAFLNRW